MSFLEAFPPSLSHNYIRFINPWPEQPSQWLELAFFDLAYPIHEQPSKKLTNFSSSMSSRYLSGPLLAFSPTFPVILSWSVDFGTPNSYTALLTDIPSETPVTANFMDSSLKSLNTLGQQRDTPELVHLDFNLNFNTMGCIMSNIENTQSHTQK